MIRPGNSLRELTMLALGLCFALITSGCDSGPATPGAAGGTLSVVASFYPIEYLARRIGGEHVEVFNPVPPGAEPHDLELTPRSIERIQKSRLFLYLGEGFQPAVDRALDTIKGPNLIVKDVAEGLQMVPGVEEDGKESGVDPHIWLDPVLAQGIAANIAAALKQADSANAATYTANADKVRADLAALDAAFKSGLASCKRKEVITSHAAFGYLARRYGLEQVPITGLSPEAEPGPARLQEIIEFAKAHDAKYIFFETLVEPKVAQLIASEVGAQTLVLNPIEGLTPDQVSAGSDYVSIMRDNLANLKTALDCE